jgi:Glycosyltransferase family 87
MRTGRESGAGLLIASAVVIKSYAVLFVPYLIARRKTASIVPVVIGLGVALLAPAALYGFEGNAARSRTGGERSPKRLHRICWIGTMSRRPRSLPDRSDPGVMRRRLRPRACWRSSRRLRSCSYGAAGFSRRPGNRTSADDHADHVA